MPAVVACCAILPSAAGAAVSVPAPPAETLATVDTAVAEAVQPVTQAAGDVAQATRPESGGMARPAGDGESHPVADTVAPIANAAAAPVTAAQAAAATSSKHLDERALTRTSHIAATSSGERMSSGRIAHGHDPQGATETPSSERIAPAHRAPSALRDAPAATAPAAAHPAAIQDLAPAVSAPGSAAASGSSGLFFGGGGLALLVASLLLAGPRLRRQLAQLPAVCRPAAFLLVLERPG
jgi:hypothetical protein